jgi:8-oxo-dGTP pyrophosphatase MutT (NUDIX family)
VTSLFPFTAALRDRIASNLTAAAVVELDAGDYRRAAVGIVLLPDERERACFVLTRRLPTLRRHAGQWALPGGRLEPGESVFDAAPREIFEEVGIRLADDALLGRLDDFASRSGHLITPLVFWSPEPAMSVNPEEVAAAFRLPLEDLDRPGNPRFEPFLHFLLARSTVFAPTAAMLYQFRELGLHGRAVRVSDVEQPRFAWR